MGLQDAPKKKGVGFFGWVKRIVLLAVLGAMGAGGYWYYQRHREVEVLKQMISRLTSEDRVAKVVVMEYQEASGEQPRKLKLKILEKVPGRTISQPVFCDFSVNNVIHFEALVIRLNDELIMEGEGKSIHFLRRAFALDDHGNTYESCDINRPMEVPAGYSLDSDDRQVSEIERRYWKSFWDYALDEKRRKADGVRTAQIEAPATRFVPNKIYTLVLEHRGGLYITAQPVDEVLEGVKIQTPKKDEEVTP